jgi:hypothetical protein
MGARDDIGIRGEIIFCNRITDFCGRSGPYFRPRFLGEKAPTCDFLVELAEASKDGAFFFDCSNLPRLHEEVEQFWAGRDMARRHSTFSV